MSLIRRQDALVAALEPIYRKNLERSHSGVAQDIIARAARVKHMHIKQMTMSGYSQSEASASAAQCAEVAWLNVISEAA